MGQCHPCSSSILGVNWAALWHRGTAALPHCRGPCARPRVRAAPARPHCGGAPMALVLTGCVPEGIHRSSPQVTQGQRQVTRCSFSRGTGDVDGSGAGPMWNSVSVLHQASPAAFPVSIDRAALLCLTRLPVLHSKSNTLVVGSSSPPKDHPKYSLPSHATSQLFLQQVRKRRWKKGGAWPGRAEPSRRDAPSTCRATCQFDGGRTASGSSRQTAVRKGGNSAPEIMVEKEPPHLEPRTVG